MQHAVADDQIEGRRLKGGFEQIALHKRCIFDLIFLQLTFLVIIAYNANHWFNEFLLKNGYQTIGFVLAISRAQARIRAARLLHHQYPSLCLGPSGSILAKL